MNNQKAIRELKRAEFYIHRVIIMVENRENCLDIIRESQIAQDALKRASKRILFYHLKNCVRKLVKNKDKEKQFKEIMTAFKLGGRYF